MSAPPTSIGADRGRSGLPFDGDGGVPDAVPLWFGPEDRPRFGWLHRPRHPIGAGVVLCPSIGLEGEASQLAFRSLAPALAAAGCTVLRFDYDGTGDSFGSFTDPDRVDSWITSIGDGLDLVAADQAGPLHLVGMRLGATLAAQAAARDDRVRSLTLWYPWATGRQFVRYQRSLRRLLPFDADSESGEGAVEISCIVFDATTAADLSALRVEDSVDGLPNEVLVIDADPDGPLPRLLDAADTVTVTRSEGAGAKQLFEVELLQAEPDRRDEERIVAFVTGQAVGPTAAVEPRAVRSVAAVGRPGGGPVEERPVTFGPNGLFGIVAEPSTPAPAAAAAPPRYRSAIFINAGNLHHVGPSRQWAELSRDWAARGMRCLRFDLGGIGDSEESTTEPVVYGYPRHAVDDIDAAIEFLAPDDRAGVVLVGLCSGAYHALMAASQLEVGAVAVVNPVRFQALTGEFTVADIVLDVPMDLAVEGEAPPAPHSRRDLRSMLARLRGRQLLRPVVEHIPEAGWWVLNRFTGDHLAARTFATLVDRGTDVHVVCGVHEGQRIERGERAALGRLTATGRFSMTVVPTLDHNFHVASGRRHAIDLLNAQVLGPTTTAASGSRPG